jgi:mevalonate kinase
VEIQINNQNLDFTIEQDETLGQVVEDIETWLKGTDLVLFSVKHEERELLATPYDQWGSTPHTEVETLDVTVKHARELAALNLQTVLEYLEILKQSIGTNDCDQLEELLSGFSALTESLGKHFPNSGQMLQALVTLFGNSRAEEVLAWTDETREQALKLIDLVYSQVSFRLQEYQDPMSALKTLTETLTVCIQEVSDISILLQTGRDKQAMDTIVRFSELSQNLVRLVASIFPGNSNKELQEFFQEMGGVLSELLEAFEAKDSVLIGDLMEYEIAPRLERLQTILQELA